MTLYLVTFETFGEGGSPGLAAIDVPAHDATLDDALSHARQLIAEGRDNVTITDGEGNSIRGSDLYACCRGEKSLTPDLRAIPN